MMIRYKELQERRWRFRRRANQQPTTECKERTRKSDENSWFQANANSHPTPVTIPIRKITASLSLFSNKLASFARDPIISINFHDPIRNFGLVTAARPLRGSPSLSWRIWNAQRSVGGENPGASEKLNAQSARLPKLRRVVTNNDHTQSLVGLPNH